MTVQWFTPRSGQFASTSADGYYLVGLALPDGTHQAYHREAAFAIPKLIGRGDTIHDAQRTCESHKAAASAPANKPE